VNPSELRASTVLTKGFGEAPAEYKQVAMGLARVGVLDGPLPAAPALPPGPLAAGPACL